MQQEKKDAFKVLQKMVFSKAMTETVKRAVRVRLQVILENEESSYERWKEWVKPKLNSTRQMQVEREFKKRIQAYKITVHSLTPFGERTEDIPTFVISKGKTKSQKLLDGLPIVKMIELVPQKVKKDPY